MSNVVPIIKKILEFRQGGTVIDIGAGFGHHSIFLAEHGFEVTSLDTDAEAVENLAKEAKEKGLSVSAMVGDVRNISELKGQWDIVICTFVLHFLQDAEVEKAVKDLKAITKSGGLNVIAAHTTENNEEEKARKPHLFQPNELKELYADWRWSITGRGLENHFLGGGPGRLLKNIAQTY